MNIVAIENVETFKSCLRNTAMKMYCCCCRTLTFSRELSNFFKIIPDVGKVFYQNLRSFSSPNYITRNKKYKMNPPKLYKVDSLLFKSCLTEEVIILKNLFESIGHEVRIVGGAVRDLLMGIKPLDLDFATTATPTEMKDMFDKNNIRLINVNGEKHGTITSRINESNFEVTTLRIDVATNGRHAEVEFTQDWVLDANRRDLTINAMYLGFDGTLYDFFNGYEDLKNKRVVFVGNASDRIQEDYLRILRYFRFYCKICDMPDMHDEDVLKAIKENGHGLANISGERIWTELNKILELKFPAETILKMIELDLGQYIGFPNNCNLTEFKKICDRLKLKDETLKPMAFLSALFNEEEELQDFFLRIKPSALERNLAIFIMNKRKVESEGLNYYLFLSMKEKKEYIIELMKYKGEFELLEEFKTARLPKFPVNGHMLMDKGIKGKFIGKILRHLKTIWFESDFTMSADELLKYVPEDPALFQKTVEKKSN